VVDDFIKNTYGLFTNGVDDFIKNTYGLLTNGAKALGLGVKEQTEWCLAVRSGQVKL
jgi:hypothetical protein